MPASAILSMPTPLAGAVSQPPAEAGTMLAMAAAAFGALVDARTVPSGETAPAAALIAPPVPPSRSAGAIQPAEAPSVKMPELGVMPPPVTEAAGAVSMLPPVPGVEGQPAAPAPGAPSMPPVQPAAETEAALVEPLPPSAGQAEPSVPLQPPAAVAPPLETAPPSVKERSADNAKTEADGGEIAAQPTAGPPQMPLPSASPIQPSAQPAPAASAQSDAEAPEAVAETRRLKAAKQAPLATNGPVSGGKEAQMSDAMRPSVQGAAAVPADVPAIADQPDGGLPSPLLTQTMAPVANRPAAAPYPHAAQATVPAPVVQAQPGRVGSDIGVEIAKAAKGDREDLLIRLDPRDMGRINVRLSFDGEGVLRAVMSAESPAALDMLRRESGDLNRALADAGIRSDAQSLRFDARSGDQGQGSGQGGQRAPHAQSAGSQRTGSDEAIELADPHYRPLRSSGQVDLMA